MKENKENRLVVRVNNTELEAIKERAEKAGLTVSQYTRKLATGHRIEARQPLLNLETFNVLAGMANNVNQIAKRANGGGEVAVNELAQIVAELRERLL